MITETEKKALQLAKKVFEHFTHDPLPIAREIIAMELELGQTPFSETAVIEEPDPILYVKKTDGQPINWLLNDFPVSDISILDSNDPSQPVKQLNTELIYQPEDDFPF